MAGLAENLNGTVDLFKVLSIFVMVWYFGSPLIQATKRFAQETTDDEKSLLPNINPPSPESFAITEYGKNSFNDFRGKANVSIPLYL